jgi:hypothetical protein
MARDKNKIKSTPKIWGCANCRKSFSGAGKNAWAAVPDGKFCDPCFDQHGAVVLPLDECLRRWGMPWAIPILMGEA